MRILHKSELCIGCRACQQACQDYHDLPAGKALMEIVERETFAGGALRVRYGMDTCRQCQKPECLPACPFGAIGRDDGGVVVIDRARCTGCGACVRACPLHHIVLSGRKAMKCMECSERVGETPVCQAACPLDCIRWEG